MTGKGFSPPQAAVVLTQAKSPSLALALAKRSELWQERTMKQRLEYQRDEHHVHLIVSHLLWCPRRRKPVLVNQVAQRCQALILEKCQQKGWQILTLAIQPDHLHLDVRCFPSTSAADVVK